MITVSCGGGGTGTQSTPVSASSNYSITVYGDSASGQLSTIVNVTVQ
jgi:hypothetical protein